MDDAFDRAVRRERELRARLAAGEVGAEEAQELRDLGGDLRLDVAQIQRMVDEGADAAAVAALVRAFPLIPVDDAIDLVGEYGMDEGCVADLVAAGLEGVVAKDLCEILWNELDPREVRRLVDAHPGLSVRRAIDRLVGGEDEEDEDDEGDRDTTVVVGVATRWRGRVVLLGGGHRTIREDATVVGLFVGDVVISEGATVTLEATVVGRVIVEEGATVVLRGKVVGEVRGDGTVVRQPMTEAV
jgi:hypothetical protein